MPDDTTVRADSAPAMLASCRWLAALVAALLFFASLPSARAQWVPTGRLAAVPVLRDCDETSGDVAASRLDPPAVYLCPGVVKLIRKTDPGAEHFYLVHEFGHIALQTSNEAAADCWAAKALAKAPGGQRYLAVAIAHFRKRPDDASPRYGTPAARAQHIRECADDPRPMEGT